MENKYITAKDLQKLINGITIYTARKYISELQQEMRKQGYWVPQTKEKVALLSIAKEKFGF